MTTLKNSEIKTANKMAYQFFFNPYNMTMDKSPNFDRRTRIDKKAHLIFKEIKKSVNINDIKAKKRTRRESMPSQYKNYLMNRIVIDYFNNFSSLKGVYNDRLSFYGRNHWAKNQEDYKILEVLKQGFLKRINHKQKAI
jgi:hypothetical protein